MSEGHVITMLRTRIAVLKAIIGEVKMTDDQRRYMLEQVRGMEDDLNEWQWEQEKKA
jgi:hypothetical protein